MNGRRRGASPGVTLGRRAALALPLALAGCGLLDDWFGEHKPPLPGKREPVLASRGGLQVDAPHLQRGMASGWR